MAAPPLLPALPGLAWSRHKSPNFSTRVAEHASGREVRLALYAAPLYEFEAAYDGLSSNGSWPGLGEDSLQALMGFFLQLQGAFSTFLYVDPDDRAAQGQAIGTGDGATTSFTIGRALGGFYEPVSYVTGLDAVYLNGVAQSLGWSLSAPNALVFASAPAAGAVIAADFSYAFECRFLEDKLDFKEFMTALWSLESMKFRSVKA